MGQWLAWFNFELEYQKGHGNMVVDVLSWVITMLDLETVKSILDGVTLGTVHWAKEHDPAMVEGSQCLEQEVGVISGHPLVEMHVTDWTEARSRQIWRCFWQSMPPVKQVNWCYGTSRIFWFIGRPCTCALCSKAKLKIWSLWSPRHTM